MLVLRPRRGWLWLSWLGLVDTFECAIWMSYIGIPRTIFESCAKIMSFGKSFKFFFENKVAFFVCKD